MIDVGIIEVASGQGGMIYVKAELGLMMVESDIVLPAVGDTMLGDAVNAHVTGCLRDKGFTERRKSDYVMIDDENFYKRRMRVLIIGHYPENLFPTAPLLVHDPYFFNVSFIFTYQFCPSPFGLAIFETNAADAYGYKLVSNG
ncbi:MAG: hypothetical protein ASARMPRED_002984 [Alectoria sarmentosa]|nr:MAG: hypothetical protein ASARMPRED_002984 [Alectoria sarmentosa]